MKGLRKLLEGFETVMTAEAFAEEGEFETAREILREQEPKRVSKRVDREYASKISVRPITKSK